MKPETIFEITKSLCLLTLTIVVSVFSYYSYGHLKDYFTYKNTFIQQQTIQLKNNIIANQVTESTRKLNKSVEDLDVSIRHLADSREQEFIEYGKIKTEIKSVIREEISRYYKDPDDSSKDYDETVAYIDDADGNKFPIAHVLYSPNLDDENKWTIKPYPIKFKTQIAIAENDIGKDVYAETTMSNDTIKEFRGKEFPLTLTKVEWIERTKHEKQFMLNLRLSGGSAVGTDIYPYLSMSLFSYGRTKRDMDWRILQFGAGGTEDKAYFHITPLEYNIGKFIPIVENIFVGAFGNVDTDLTYGGGGCISIPF